jgi:uncharacterized protein YecT (DUF1311 family)
VLVTLALSGTANAQRSESAAAECFKRGSHPEQRECLLERERKADAGRAAAEQTLLDTIRASGEDPSTVQRVTDLLAKAFTEYQAYRAIHCDAVASLALGGNGESDRRMLCHIELDIRRATELKAEGHGV